MTTQKEMAKKKEIVDVHFQIERELRDRIEYNMKLRDRNASQWWIQSGSHYLHCEGTAVTQHWHTVFTKFETVCLKCAKAIPKCSRVMYDASAGVLCPECYVQGWGDKARLKLLQENDELKNDNRILDDANKDMIEKVKLLNHQEKLAQVLDKLNETATLDNETQKRIDEAVKHAESCFKEFSTVSETGELKTHVKELKEEIVRIKDKTDEFKDQVEATQPLVRDLEHFDEEYFLQRLKKRKPLKQVSEQGDIDPLEYG